MDQWKRHLDPEGRVTCVEQLRQVIFEGGVEPDLRPVVWKYLLGYYLWDNTERENELLRDEKHREYQLMKRFWKEMSADRRRRFSLFAERKTYIDKDVPRTDRTIAFFRDNSSGRLSQLSDILLTYTIYNMDFGYFQGMNDLLALILYVVKNEEDSFWCFAGLLDRLESNFDADTITIVDQIKQVIELVDLLDPAFGEYLELKGAKDAPFSFRWLLVHFKREFCYKDIMVLWEAIWSDHLTKNYHIFFATAILLSQRQVIIDNNYDSNSILKFIQPSLLSVTTQHLNDLTLNIPLETTMNLATAQLKQLDLIVGQLPDSIRQLIHGPSLAASARRGRKMSEDGRRRQSDAYLLTMDDQIGATSYNFDDDEDQVSDDVAAASLREPNRSIKIPLFSAAPIDDDDVSPGRDAYSELGDQPSLPSYTARRNGDARH